MLSEPIVTDAQLPTHRECRRHGRAYVDGEGADCVAGGAEVPGAHIRLSQSRAPAMHLRLFGTGTVFEGSRFAMTQPRTTTRRIC